MTGTRRTTLQLNELPMGQWASVTEINVPTDGPDRDLVLRLVELGFVPGERVRVVAIGQPGREPVAVRLGGTTFALRRHEASFILVTTEP
jgi:Fe2+ transport system protein FeoA